MQHFFLCFFVVLVPSLLILREKINGKSTHFLLPIILILITKVQSHRFISAWFILASAKLFRSIVESIVALLALNFILQH